MTNKYQVLFVSFDSIIGLQTLVHNFSKKKEAKRFYNIQNLNNIKSACINNESVCMTNFQVILLEDGKELKSKRYSCLL